MKPKNTFVVKRSQWQRGKGYGMLAKATATNTMRCCLGFYGNQICGLTDHQLDGLISPAKTIKYGNPALWGELTETDTENCPQDSSICSEIMGLNDSKEITEEEREEYLTSLFLELGKQIIFVD